MAEALAGIERPADIYEANIRRLNAMSERLMGVPAGFASGRRSSFATPRSSAAG